MVTASEFNKMLKENGLLNEIYKAMESDDYSDVVMAVINSLKKGNILFGVKRENKCERLSDNYRNEGNIAFKRGDTILAMHCYNKALRYAPYKSRAMLLAYSNRSAVLFTTTNFAECLWDIEMCFRLGCPSDIVEKLNKRKELAAAQNVNRNMLADIRAMFKRFLQIRNRNAEVPCASADLDIVVKDGEAKITAAKDIKVGTVLASESSFVGSNNYKAINMGSACRYCFSTSFNLIPCHRCCFIMFCSEKCKRKCNEEYHNVECQIIEAVVSMDFCPKTMLMVTGALKFVQMCGTWKEAIAESHCTGTERRCLSKASQMFDVGNKLSILNYEEDFVFVHGNMYEMSFCCAKIIDSLDKLPSYFPQPSKERALAKRALARIMMYLALYAKPTQVVLFEQPSSQFATHVPIKFSNHGLYPFIGGLKNSCMPNTIAVYVCQKTVLIALQPILKGTEVTLSHMQHYSHNYWSPFEKNFESLQMFGIVCKCFVCAREWETRPCLLTEKQHAAYKKYVAQGKPFNPLAPFHNFDVICDTLACLASAPFSREYIQVCTDFRDRIVIGNWFGKYEDN